MYVATVAEADAERLHRLSRPDVCALEKQLASRNRDLFQEGSFGNALGPCANVVYS